MNTVSIEADIVEEKTVSELRTATPQQTSDGKPKGSSGWWQPEFRAQHGVGQHLSAGNTRDGESLLRPKDHEPPPLSQR